TPMTTPITPTASPMPIEISHHRVLRRPIYGQCTPARVAVLLSSRHSEFALAPVPLSSTTTVTSPAPPGQSHDTVVHAPATRIAVVDAMHASVCGGPSA